MKTTPPARFSKLPTTSLPLSLLTVALLTSTGDAQRQASPGSDAAIGIEGPLRYGRIVDVHAKSPKTGAVVPALRDVLVGEGAGVSAKASTANPAVPLTLREDPASGVSILEIGAEFDTRDESDFARALLEARRAAGVVAPATASSLPPFSEVPVDAAIAVELSAPLDPRSLTAESLRFTTGSNDRAAAGRLVWNAREPRQVLFDPKVGAADLARVEAELASGIRWNARLGHAPLHGFAAGQSHGFTPGGQSLGWNVRVQLATSGATLQSSAGVKPTAAQPPLSLTRVFRSGGPATALASTSVFTLIGTQGITPLTVGDSDPGTPGNDFLRVTFQYVDPTRDLGVQPGDSILQGVSFAIVQSVVDGTGPVYTADVTYVEGGAFVEKRVTDLTSLFGPQHAGKEGCFIGVRPQPLTFPMGGVDPQLQVFLAFSKPVDPATVDPLENVAVVVNGAVNPTNAGPFDVAVATAFDDTGDPARILYTPVLPLPHVQGQSEAYRLYVLGGAAGIRALDGSVLSFGLLDFQVPLTIDPAAPTNGSRGLSLRFNGILEGGGPQKVVNGQLSTPAPGTIAGRPVTHFVRYTDSTNPVVAAMQPFNAAGVQTPLVPLGSREMIAYRHVDIGLSVNALSEMDLDIEGLSWSIFNLFPPTDYFPHIKIAASHSRIFPD
jgi:hypothetical protein